MVGVVIVEFLDLQKFGCNVRAIRYTALQCRKICLPVSMEVSAEVAEIIFA
jgi:hypothetical protein